MNNINKIIQQREKNLYDEFGDLNKIETINTSILREKIKNFNKETNKMIIDEVVRMVEETEEVNRWDIENGESVICKSDIIKELKQLKQ